MKTLAELEAIRQKTLDSVNLRREHEGTRVVVGMATCGIAAGARPVMLAFVEEVNKRNLARRDRGADRLHRHVPPGADGGDLRCPARKRSPTSR